MMAATKRPGGSRARGRRLAALPAFPTTRLTGAELLQKYGALPTGEREQAMWFAGFEAGKNEGVKAFQDRLVELLGINALLRRHEAFHA